MNITSEELAGMKRCCEAATKGPWHLHVKPAIGDPATIRTPDENGVTILVLGCHGKLDDLKLAAKSRTDLPRVIDALIEEQKRADSTEEVFHQLRLKLTEACGNPYLMSDEALASIVTERDALRAEIVGWMLKGKPL